MPASESDDVSFDGGPAIVGLPDCLVSVDGVPFHVVGDKYVRAVVAAVGAMPVTIPAVGGALDLDRLLDRLDGLLITGSPSNVEPSHYAGPASVPGTPHDPARDATTLPLIRRAIARGVPLLAICRGIQELNVAFGGSLHQDVAGVPGRTAHHAPEGVSQDEKYAPAHPAHLTPGGLLAELAGAEEILINSVHYQAIDRLGERLVVEARAPDGTIEAVRVADAPAFALGLQWHPEWRFWENPVSEAIFTAFGAATAARARARA